MKRATDTGAECRGQLLLRARRGGITDNERLALAAHLSTCEACQLLNDFGRDFEAVGGAAPGDSAILSRISQRALRSARAPSFRAPRSRLFWLAAASVVLLAGLAGATLLTRSQPQRPTPSSEPVSNPATTEGAAPPASAPSVPSSLPASASGEPEASASTPLLGSARAKLSVASRSVDSAGSLFRQANEARRSADGALAVSLYRELQRRFPAAPETRISRVSLGSTLLDRGAAAPALEQFESYLAGPAGPLAAEAMYGRGRALNTLHRTAEERATWQALVDRFPRAPYASYAKRRLDELD